MGLKRSSIYESSIEEESFGSIDEEDITDLRSFKDNLSIENKK